MAENNTFEELRQSYAELRRELAESEELAALREYVAENRNTYESFTQEGRYAELRQAVRRAGTVVTDAVKVEQQRALNTVTWMTDSAPVTFGDQLDESSLKINTANASKVPETKSPGHATYSAYLQSSQPQMNAQNAKEVDYNVLSELAYAAKFNSNPANQAAYLKASQRDGITIKEYCEGLLEHLDDTPENLSNRIFLQELANSERYGNLKIDHAIGRTGSEAGSQTQVLVINCGDGHAVMAVEGTNGKLADWQNNSGFAGSDPTHEEQWVTATMNRYASEYDSIALTGHSQGGREAVTAGMFMDAENQSKITCIYSNDGPGYSTAFIDKHGEQISRIEDKVVNIRPEGSFVGTLEKPVGKVKYIRSTSIITGYDANGNPKHTCGHEGTCWYVDENGNYVEAEQTWWSQAIDDFTPVLTDFLTTVMPEERVKYYLDNVFALISDNEGNFLKLGNLTITDIIDRIKNAKELGEEFIAEFEAGMERIREDQLSDFEKGLYSFCSELDNVLGDIDKYLSYAETICEVLEVVLAGTAYGAIIAEAVKDVIKIVRTVIKVVRYICKAIKIILNIVAYFRERRMRRAREKYIGENPEIEVLIEALDAASQDLYQVASELEAANRSAREMLNHFKKKTYEFPSPLPGVLDANTKPVEKIRTLSQSEAFSYLMWHSGFRGVSDSMISKVRSAAGKISEIADTSRNLFSESSLPSSNYFRVYMSTLSQSGAEGVSETDTIQAQVDKVNDAVIGLKPDYYGEDADSLQTKWQEYYSQLGPLVENYRKMFESLQQIAEMYQKYQAATIESFQKLKV